MHLPYMATFVLRPDLVPGGSRSPQYHAPRQQGRSNRSPTLENTPSSPNILVVVGSVPHPSTTPRGLLRHVKIIREAVVAEKRPRDLGGLESSVCEWLMKVLTPNEIYLTR